MDLWFKSYEVFYDFRWTLGMLLAIANAVKFAQICPKLPKIAQNLPMKLWNSTKNWDFGFFSKKTSILEEASKHEFTVWIFNLKIFHMPFSMSKNGLCLNFSIPLCAEWHFFQGSVCLMDMRFCWHVPNSPRNKNLKSLNPYLLYKMVFLATKTLLYSLSIGKKTFFFQLWTLWSCTPYGMNV